MRVQVYLSSHPGYALVLAKREDGSNINYPGTLVRFDDLRDVLGIDPEMVDYEPTDTEADEDALKLLGALEKPLIKPESQNNTDQEDSRIDVYKEEEGRVDEGNRSVNWNDPRIRLAWKAFLRKHSLKDNPVSRRKFKSGVRSRKIKVEALTEAIDMIEASEDVSITAVKGLLKSWGMKQTDSETQPRGLVTWFSQENGSHLSKEQATSLAKKLESQGWICRYFNVSGTNEWSCRKGNLHLIIYFPTRGNPDRDIDDTCVVLLKGKKDGRTERPASLDWEESEESGTVPKTQSQFSNSRSLSVIQSDVLERALDELTGTGAVAHAEVPLGARHPGGRPDRARKSSKSAVSTKTGLPKVRNKLTYRKASVKKKRMKRKTEAARGYCPWSAKQGTLDLEDDGRVQFVATCEEGQVEIPTGRGSRTDGPSYQSFPSVEIDIDLRLDPLAQEAYSTNPKEFLKNLESWLPEELDLGRLESRDWDYDWDWDTSGSNDQNLKATLTFWLYRN